MKLLKDRQKDKAMQTNYSLDESLDPGTSSRVAEPPMTDPATSSLDEVPSSTSVPEGVIPIEDVNTNVEG